MTPCSSAIGQLDLFQLAQLQNAENTGYGEPLVPGKDELDKAIAEVSAHANPDWRAYALRVVEDLAYRYEELTTDAVWRVLDASNFTTHDPRALGSIMRHACKEGWIAPTDRVMKTSRPEAHRRPIAVWRSLLFSSC